jgi:DNA processing protein
MVTSAADIIEALNWDRVVQDKADRLSYADFSDDETAIIKLLKQKEAVMIDDISVLTQIPINHIAALLLGLEFKNIVRNVPGKKYKLNSEISF